MQATGFFNKALEPAHTVKCCEWQMDMMRPEVQPYSDTAPSGSPVHAWNCGISLLGDSKLLLPHSLAPVLLLLHCPRDPFLFQLSVQPSMARAAKICMEPSRSGDT